jgi:hypothetical protein
MTDEEREKKIKETKVWPHKSFSVPLPSSQASPFDALSPISIIFLPIPLPLPSAAMLIKVVTDQQRNHVPWLINYIRERELPPIKQTLDECYALLAPVLPGTTLVLSTRRNELVKGTVTRVGTRIVKAVRSSNISLRGEARSRRSSEEQNSIHRSN